MKKVDVKEMRTVEGGMWKCKNCDTKFLFYIQAKTHQNCEAHYSGLKWCLW